jgi:creatinine amidohydrolase/Fe(II)-dependent formamide hydrolase-like protein
VLSLPVMPVGLDEHHTDFPGTVGVDMELLLTYVAQCPVSVARRGFQHIMIVNDSWLNISFVKYPARCQIDGNILFAIARRSLVRYSNLRLFAS